MTWKHWLHGLLAAAIGSLGTLGSVGVAGYARNYDLLNWDFWEPVVAAALLNGWIAVKLYIRQFPPPGTLKPQEPPAV
jgi:hypothetical protein